MPSVSPSISMQTITTLQHSAGPRETEETAGLEVTEVEDIALSLCLSSCSNWITFHVIASGATCIYCNTMTINTHEGGVAHHTSKLYQRP